jgi:hypothetical protein
VFGSEMLAVAHVPVQTIQYLRLHSENLLVKHGFALLMHEGVDPEALECVMLDPQMDFMGHSGFDSL